MKKRIHIIAIAVALTAVVPASRAEQADTPKQSLSAKIKQKYLERRAQFMHRVKDVYFAVGASGPALESAFRLYDALIFRLPSSTRFPMLSRPSFG